MFAGAAREAVFSNTDVIRRIKADFIPVALKAGLVNNPPNNLEGKLYREIARSKPAPQGICVVNSDGKVLSWSLMFETNQSVVDFLDHCLQRFRKYPDAKKPFTAQRYMRFPRHKLPDVPDSGKVIAIPKNAKCRVDPLLPRGTLVGRIIGRALDEKGNPIADTLKQEHYLEARIHVSPELQEQFISALKKAGKQRFRVPGEFAHALVGHAYLGQLDVNPIIMSRAKIERRHWMFSAQRVPTQQKELTRVYVTGNSDIAGRQRGGTDRRRWSHAVKLKWQGYIDIKKSQVTRLMMVARGTEKLRWDNRIVNFKASKHVSHLPAGHPIDLQCGVRYGLLAELAPERLIRDAPMKNGR